MEVSFPTDSDGFLSQECPSCAQRFKVLFEQGSSEPISHCAYCGFVGQNCWHTREQVEYANAVIMSAVVAPELDKLRRELTRSSSGWLKIGLKADIPVPPPPPVETDVALDILHFPCCNETVKVTPHASLFCIICGREINMVASESKKVFLSHKGVDKQRVIDFQKALISLGYDPWLDDDSMPAGTSLERGLLKGMEESCAVVFFVTPSFKDEGYLQTEVDYAIAQKREKAERFSIITLQFGGGGGPAGEIPKLLKGYVWKTPSTDLEALREIVRALPVAPGTIDWREHIRGVVTAPKLKSTSAELSEEAKAILKAAVARDGVLSYVTHSGGAMIRTGTTSLIPDQEPRTVARWTGGLEDLQRRRYIKDRGHKGAVFDVTREGFEAADTLA